MYAWLSSNEEWFALLGAISLMAFTGSLIVVPIIILNLPVDFFTRPIRTATTLSIARLCLKAAKNIVGGLFLLSGILMLILPGQGILSILIGLSLIDFPAKRRVQVRIIRMPRVQRMVNWIRKKGNRKPIEIPPAWES